MEDDDRDPESHPWATPVAAASFEEYLREIACPWECERC